MSDARGERTSAAVSSTTTSTPQQRAGWWFGLGAYGWWGLVPLYFKRVAHLPPLDVVAHRIVWSFALLAIVVLITRRGAAALRAWRSPAIMAYLSASTVFIAINWFTYIYAVSSSQVVQASLGYFITPLANVLLGVVVLKERLRRWQVVALSLAAGSVVYLGSVEGKLPWIALALAGSFSCYGLMRKLVPIEGLLGLFIETTLMAPLSIAYLVWQSQSDPTAFTRDLPTLALLAFGGLVTTVPLLLFAAAAHRLSMTTLGFFQYLAPSIQFLLAVLLFHEPVSTPKIAAFMGIWGAVALYTADSLWVRRVEAGRSA